MNIKFSHAICDKVTELAYSFLYIWLHEMIVCFIVCFYGHHFRRISEYFYWVFHHFSLNLPEIPKIVLFCWSEQFQVQLR